MDHFAVRESSVEDDEKYVGIFLAVSAITSRSFRGSRSVSAPRKSSNDVTSLGMDANGHCSHAKWSGGHTGRILPAKRALQPHFGSVVI